MIDLTLNDKDRDNFITKLYLKENSNKYIVRYASGRLDEQEFSIHNFNATLYRMEEQFLEYKTSFVRNNLRLQARIQGKKLVEALLAILGIVITLNIPMPEIVQGIIVGILSLYTFLYQVESSRVLNYGQALLNVVSIADKFLEIKDQFKINVIDPKSGQEEDWYLVTLAGIEHVNGIDHLKFLSDMLTDERKMFEREETERVLNNKMCL